MSYKYDLADFKRYLHDRNASYRVDGLIFWQKRIPIPIDLFNRIFEESDQIVCDYIFQLAASTLVFNNSASFEHKLGVSINDLPTDSLGKIRPALADWVWTILSGADAISCMVYEVADMLGVVDFEFSQNRVVEALLHQGKKYSRLFIPDQVRCVVRKFVNCNLIGQDNTDMFGNIIADRYDIYRSGFSDALAIIFNLLLEFRISFSGKGVVMQRVSVISSAPIDLDVRFGLTTDGSLWEPGFEDDHYVIINNRHPLIRELPEDEVPTLAELFFFLARFENSQFSDQNKKFIENLRQTISRDLWIKHD